MGPGVRKKWCRNTAQLRLTETLAPTGATTSQGEWFGERASSTGEFVARGGQDAIATYLFATRNAVSIRNVCFRTNVNALADDLCPLLEVNNVL